MTIAGWFVFIILGLLFLVIGIGCSVALHDYNNNIGAITSMVITVAVIVGLFFGMRWYFQNTASGQRALVDQKSDMGNGLERTITVYTADGNIIAHYEGKIDLGNNDGGYVVFDFEGKRYMYYNCFVETIANIN